MVTESYHLMAGNLIRDTQAESVEQKINVLGSLFQNVIAQDASKMTKVVIDAGDCTLELEIGFMAAIAVVPKPEKNQIN